jgi:carbamoyltransferase
MATAHILGISAFYHDSAAALVSDGRIVAAAQEERFSRRKNDEEFPKQAVEFCLRQAGIHARDLSAVVFYDKPILKFSRLLETCLGISPRGFPNFLRVMPSWLGGKLNLQSVLRDSIPGLESKCPILFTQHHLAHAASAFLPSPFQEAAILTVDGVGEYATTTIGAGRDNRIELQQELRFPHSLGLLYSTFTAYCGFRVNSGEYKLMGLAPYGEPRFAERIRSELLDLKPDGSFRLNLDYFGFLFGQSMSNERFHALFGGPPRKPEDPIESRHLDVARSIQCVTEEVMLALARRAREVSGSRNLCMAGGVALNCVANGHIQRAGIFDRIWIQPAAGDAGGALGAACLAWAEGAVSGGVRPDRVAQTPDSMQGSLLGPAFTDAEIEDVLKSEGAVYERLDEAELLRRTAQILADGKIVGWVQGRMEFGPRALGNRSILGDARSPAMQSAMNLKIKFRESFRPFAPIVLADRAQEYFDLQCDSPYMLMVAPVLERHRKPVEQGLEGLDRLRQQRSTIPAVTHVDYSARIQTVTQESNRLLHTLLTTFDQQTGCPVLVNTSFNVRGEPVVCTPGQAYRCFTGTDMDFLAVGPFLLDRTRQPAAALARRAEVKPD